MTKAANFIQFINIMEKSMKFNNTIKVYGDISYRGKCPLESNEQISFINWIRRNHPEIGRVATHIRNEGKRSYNQAARQKAEGMCKGASDIIIPASPAFVCEIKRADHTQSVWQDGQLEYLTQAQRLGAFSCVALGVDGAIEAFNLWLSMITIKST